MLPRVVKREPGLRYVIALRKVLINTLPGRRVGPYGVATDWGLIHVSG
jgi:hypothetical protein